MNGQVPIHWLVVGGVLSAGAGAVGTLVVQRLLPEPSPGDGFSVRWLSADGSEKRVDFGPDEKAALERAISLASRQYVDVEVVEIRQGRVVRVQRAGQAPKEVVEA